MTAVNTSDLLASESLLITLLGVVFGVWYPEINAATRVEIPIHLTDAAPIGLTAPKPVVVHHAKPAPAHVAAPSQPATTEAPPPAPPVERQVVHVAPTPPPPETQAPAPTPVPAPRPAPAPAPTRAPPSVSHSTPSSGGGSFESSG